MFNRIKSALLILLKAPDYNTPGNWRFFWNQWLHQGYLWGWYSFEFYSKYQVNPFDD